jgi:hypothetical protein
MFRVVFDESVAEQVSWVDRDGQDRFATLPRVTFARAASGARSMSRNGTVR